MRKQLKVVTMLHGTAYRVALRLDGFSCDGRLWKMRRHHSQTRRWCQSVSNVHTPFHNDTANSTNQRSASVPLYKTDALENLRVPVGLAEIVAPVETDLQIMNANLRKTVGDRHPMLLAAADQIFGAGGKKLRPLIVLLVARATLPVSGIKELTEKHRRLAEITEMIHTASLVHDDVIDDCDVRRGKATVNSVYGTRMAVLVGDFLFAQSSWNLANLENLEVIKLISQVIADFANGEISQASVLFDTETTLENYMNKSFFKTASLIAASCRCSAIFSDLNEAGKAAMYAYGKHLGLAFQIVDDILDFTQSTEQLGKPQGQDLASGNLTAPVIFALRKSSDLQELIEEEFREDGSLETAIQLVKSVGGITDAMQFASDEALKARAALSDLPDSPSKQSLQLMTNYVLNRMY